MAEQIKKFFLLLGRRMPMVTIIFLLCFIAALLKGIGEGGSHYIETIIAKLESLDRIEPRFQRLETRMDDLKQSVNALVARRD